MSCPIFASIDTESLADFFIALQARDNPQDNTEGGSVSAEDTVRAIVNAVKEKGLAAVIDYTRRFDAPDFTEAQFCVTESAMAEAIDLINPADFSAIKVAAENIRSFHLEQHERSWFTTRQSIDNSAGTAILGQIVIPVDRAGLYVPGGKGGATPLISSLLMNAIPAQVAGVKEIAVISPPRTDGSLDPHILAAAHFLGITEVYAAGSAWGIGALAFGAGSMRPVDVIAGPGNIFVATAKRLLIGKVGIDMIAGPSEICIIADEGADAAWLAADMLSQAEHDTLASSVCICLSKDKAEAVALELERQCQLLPRKDIAFDALRKYGAIIIAADMDEAITIANRIAPEHLELMVADPWALLPSIRHAGAVFMGYHAAEPLGDYYAGPNHVLPTMGTARFSSALSTSIFCKRTSILAPTAPYAAASAEAIARLARLEGLEAHARSALCRGWE